jgi:hypothetical protein
VERGRFAEDTGYLTDQLPFQAVEGIASQKAISWSEDFYPAVARRFRIAGAMGVKGLPAFPLFSSPFFLFS